VRLTRDGVPVAHHDPALSRKRCLAAPGKALPRDPIGELALEDLAGVDCGSITHRRFPRQKASPGAGVPLLDQVLALSREATYAVRFSVEIKRQDGVPPVDAVRTVIERLAEHQLLDRSILQSYEPEHLVAAAHLAPSLKRAILVRWPWRYERMV
jgi:glycerophosphoryl diester phosphodiesterase